MVLAATASAALTFIPVAQAVFPGRNGRLASSYAYGCGTPIIITITSGGAAIDELTPCDTSDDPPEASFEPDWSPNGRRIVFTRTSYLAPARIAVMNADGSRQRDVALTGPQPVPLTNFDEVTYVGGPSFSPDGKHFAYTRSYSPSIGENIRSEVWVAALDGSEDRMLRRGSSPLWSPDGRRIVYIVEPPELSGNTAVKDGGTWLMNAQTGHRGRRIARSSLQVLDWSPDAQRLLYFPRTTPAARRSTSREREPPAQTPKPGPPSPTSMAGDPLLSHARGSSRACVLGLWLTFASRAQAARRSRCRSP